MKKILLGLVLCGVASVGFADEQVDWTPLFKSWEKGCDYSTAYQSFVSNLVDINNQNIVLPIQYLSAISHKINTKTPPNNDYFDFSVNVKNGTYYGIPVTRIGYLSGNNHGFSEGYIEINPTDQQLRQFLSSVKFENIYRGEVLDDYVGGIVNVKMDKVIISCNVST